MPSPVTTLKDLLCLTTRPALSTSPGASGAACSAARRFSATAKGWPDLIPELTYTLTGIKEEIAAITRLGSHVAHSFTTEAYTTSLELESKLPDGEEILDLAEEATKAVGGALYE